MQNHDVDFVALFERPLWMRDALCREHPEVEFFPGRGDDTRPAKAVCSACAVGVDCLDYALSMPRMEGIWGGTSEKERRRRRNPTAA